METLPLEIMMRKKCLLTLLLLFLPPPAEMNLRRAKYYYLHHNNNMYKKTWKNTQHNCRNHWESDMITIRNEVDNRNFRYAFGWIGLYRENSTSKWKWSRREEVADFLIWENGNPADGKNCAFKRLGENGWRSGNCDERHRVMCSRELLGLVKENKTWEDALMHCRGLEAKDPSKPFTPYENYKYDLATLLTEDDHKFARETAKSATTDEIWTGLRYLAGYWLWVGGEERKYKDIDRCPSRGFCGTLPTTGNDSYEMRPCNEKRNFFCYRKT